MPEISVQVHPPGRPAIPQMDTIRVLAMLGVFLHHLWKAIMLHPQGALQWGLDVLFSASSDGVVLFNILSGFLLALPYLGDERRPFIGYRHFLDKRFLRIIPPYYIALLLFSFWNVQAFGIPPGSALHTLLLHMFFVNSFSYSLMATNFSHFWYLGMLAHFYLLFPLILRLFQRAGPMRATVLIIAFCWGGWGLLALYLSANPDSALGMAGYLVHFNVPGRLPEFAIGMWLASVWSPAASSLRERAVDRPFLLFIISMIVYLMLTGPFVRTMNLPLTHIYHVALCVVFMVFMVFWAPVARVGRSGPVKLVSGLSYAIYIVHEPLTSYIGVMPGKVPGNMGAFLGYLVILLPLSCIGAKAINWLAASIMRRIGGRTAVSPSIP